MSSSADQPLVIDLPESTDELLRLNLTPLDNVVLRIPEDQLPLTDGAESAEGDAKAKKGRQRMRYRQWQRDLVLIYYEICDSREEKIWLCDLAHIPDIRRLYNLACALKITRKNEDLSDKEFWRYRAGDKTVMSQRKKLSEIEEAEILKLREDPNDPDLFTAEDDKALIKDFGKVKIVEIAKTRGHSETAIMYRARHLTAREKRPDGSLSEERALRQASQAFELDRVASWLGLTVDEVKALQAAGVQIRPIKDREHKTVKWWVMAESLVDFLGKFGARLVEERDADRFFIKEVLECAELIAKGELEYEGCYFVDHGHVCNNPWAGAPCGWFCRYGEDTAQDGQSDQRKCRVWHMRW